MNTFFVHSFVHVSLSPSFPPSLASYLHNDL